MEGHSDLSKVGGVTLVTFKTLFSSYCSTKSGYFVFPAVTVTQGNLVLVLCKNEKHQFCQMSYFRVRENTRIGKMLLLPLLCCPENKILEVLYGCKCQKKQKGNDETGIFTLLH